MRGNQHFAYDPKTRQIKHVSTRLCLDCDIEAKTIFMAQCNATSDTQKWEFGSFNATLIYKDLGQYL